MYINNFMNDNLSQTATNITKKEKLIKFYKQNKKVIFSFILFLVFGFVGFSFYLDNKEKKRILLSENYVQAKIYLENGNKDKAKDILKKVIFANDSTYSTLCLYLILNQNLITEHKELLGLFDHLLLNNKFSDDERSLLIYKKALYSSNFINESEFLEFTRPLLKKDTFWKSHALLLLGDYFMFRGENVKAIEFYQKIFTIKNLDKELYNHAQSQLRIISNE